MVNRLECGSIGLTRKRKALGKRWISYTVTAAKNGNPSSNPPPQPRANVTTCKTLRPPDPRRSANNQ
jgi:hypothetical protein